MVDSWAESLFIATSEVLDRQRAVQGVMLDSSVSAHREAMSTEVLGARVEDLQGRLMDAEKRVKGLENENNTLGMCAVYAPTLFVTCFTVLPSLGLCWLLCVCVSVCVRGGCRGADAGCRT
mgnify:CR=1 FL=1